MTGSTAGQATAPRRRRRAWPLLGGLLAMLLLLLPASAGAEPTPTPAVVTGVAFTLGDPRITESSGLAADPEHYVFWTVNDSGDRGVVFAIGPDGRTRGTVEFAAQPVDVEALAYADGRLYIADIGDNLRNRESVRVYVIESPTPGRDRGEDFTTYEFVYPDGPRDAEAILVDASGRIRIISKEADGGIYAAPRQLSTSQPNRLTRVADATSYVTDATVLPTGQFAVRTYVGVEVLDPELFDPVARATLPFQRQGESMTVSLAGNALLVGSEGAQSAVLRVPIPTELQTAPTPMATPPPSPTPTPQPTPEAVPISAGINRSGTLVALGLAILLSVAAGLVVFFRDRGSFEPAPLTARRGWDDSPTPEAAQSPVLRPPGEQRVVTPEEYHADRARAASFADDAEADDDGFDWDASAQRFRSTPPGEGAPNRGLMPWEVGQQWDDPDDDRPEDGRQVRRW